MLDRLSTLSHPQRMAIFRLLVRRYPDSLAVGEILEILNLKPSTASVYLSALKSADLVNQKRRGTHLYYSANIDASQELITGLFKDCCGNRADLCFPQRDEQSHKPNVLFLCTGNSARSIMAESILSDWPNAPFSVASAGTVPRSRPNQIALDVLESKGHDISGLKSKHISELTDETQANFDFVLTVCDSAANEDLGAFAGTPVVSHWSTLDPVPNDFLTPPAAENRQDFHNAYDILRNRISEFVALPFKTTHRRDLQKMVDDIAHNSSGQS